MTKTSKFNPKKIFNLSFLLLLIIQKSTSTYYTTFNLKDSLHLCEDLHLYPLKLGDGIESAIKLNLYHKQSFHCQFEITPRSEKHGIVVVIQDMKFRKRPNSSECIDYIMFKGKKYGKVSKKFCGSFDVESAMERFVVKKASLIAMASKNVYQSDLDDDVMVIIHMNVNHNETNSNYYDLGAELVLTSYTNCRSNPPWFYKPCISKNLDTICIEDVYFTDGYVNCPFKGCVDEGTCVPLMVKIYGKRIFIGTIIGVIISVCLSVCCFFYCTPYKERSVEQQNDLPPNYMLPRIDDDEETDFSSDEEGMRRFDEEIGKESEEERENWDKPPLYESLFPEGPSFSKP